MPRLCCITYVDTYSVDKDAYQDFLIGVHDHMVGCNNLSFSKSIPGDLVIINAKNKTDSKNYRTMPQKSNLGRKRWNEVELYFSI